MYKCIPKCSCMPNKGEEEGKQPERCPLSLSACLSVCLSVCSIFQLNAGNTNRLDMYRQIHVIQTVARYTCYMYIGTGACAVVPSCMLQFNGCFTLRKRRKRRRNRARSDSTYALVPTSGKNLKIKLNAPYPISIGPRMQQTELRQPSE